MADSIWVKEGYFWRRKDPWLTSGIGDIIFNTMTKIVIDNDTSDWAFEAFFSCSRLLAAGKRWPDEYNDTYKERSQTGMTRDPYIAFGACYSHLLGQGDDNELKYNLQAVKPPFKIWWWTPSFYIWWRRLTRDNRRQFVNRLGYFKALAEKNIYEKEEEDDFYKD